MESGTIWRKWDLHIHSPCSFHHEFRLNKSVPEENYQEAIWDEYIKYLEEVQDISVIGITDYFSIDGYKKVLDYRSRGFLKNFDALLPNIEFRLDIFVDGKRLNYHVIFSDEVPVEKIEKEFLETLTIKTKSGYDRHLTRENLEELGREVKNHQPEFQTKSDYEVGCINATVSVEQIINNLRSRGPLFEGKYLLVLVDEDWNRINWKGQGHVLKSILFGGVHAIFSSSEKTREFALGKMHTSLDKYIEEFGNPKACLHGSDTHSFENFCIPSNNKYCWIKADPNFDGLKQIVYEPEERVRIQLENPEYRKNIFSLKSVTIKNCEISPDLSFYEQKIPLNSNLIAITGGKGSGKTALVDFIANCYENRCKSGGKDKNSFIQRIETEKQDLNVTIEFIGDGVDKFSKNIVDPCFTENSKITYLPQGKIEEYSGDHQKLDEKIFEIVFNNNLIIESNYKEKFDTLKQKAELIAQNIDDYNHEISILEKATSEDIINSIELSRKLKLGELKNKEEELRAITTEIEEGISEKINLLKISEKELRQTLKKYQTLQSSVSDVQQYIDVYSKGLNAKVDRINTLLSELELEAQVPTIETNSISESLLTIHALIPEKSEVLTAQITALNEELSKLTGSEKKQAELLKEIEGKNLEMSELNKKIEEIHSKRKNIVDLSALRVSKYLEMLEIYSEWRAFYDEIIESFSQGKDTILSDITFAPRINFNDQNFIDLGLEIFNKRRIHYEDIEGYAKSLSKVIFEVDNHTREELLKDLLAHVLSSGEYLKPTRSKSDLYRWIFGNYLSLSTEIKFWNIPIEKLSMGQKGTVLLKLFMAEGDYPIIFDQPEENLDNRYIYNELVTAIRDAKKRRQIIIATNNANLVVNTDAEQLIVANYENKRISYKFGSLENKEVREHIMPILEGGKEAFRKREEKYDIIGMT